MRLCPPARPRRTPKKSWHLGQRMRIQRRAFHIHFLYTHIHVYSVLNEAIFLKNKKKKFLTFELEKSFSYLCTFL